MSSMSRDRISDSCLCLILIDSTRSDGVCSEGEVDVLVDEDGEGEAVGDAECDGGAKKTVRVAKPS